MNSKPKSVGEEFGELSLTVLFGIPGVPLIQIGNGLLGEDPYSLSKEARDKNSHRTSRVLHVYETLSYPVYLGARELRKGLKYLFQ